MPLKRYADRLAAARTWLENAATDLELATTIASDFPARACFHAQQCCEMALKAALIAIADDRPRTHVGGKLVGDLAALGAAVPAGVEAAANRLDLFYVASRHPDALGGADPRRVLGEADARGAIDLAGDVLAFATHTVDGEAA